MAQLARTSFRERIERLEDESLSPLATRSYPAVRAEPESIASRCQTGGRLLSDRSLSRLLRDDWPKTLDELETRRARQTRRAKA